MIITDVAPVAPSWQRCRDSPLPPICNSHHERVTKRGQLYSHYNSISYNSLYIPNTRLTVIVDVMSASFSQPWHFKGELKRLGQGQIRRQQKCCACLVEIIDKMSYIRFFFVVDWRWEYGVLLNYLCYSPNRALKFILQEWLPSISPKIPYVDVPSKSTTSRNVS